MTAKINEGGKLLGLISIAPYGALPCLFYVKVSLSQSTHMQQVLTSAQIRTLGGTTKLYFT